MQLQSESNPALNTVTAYGENYIEINAVTFQHAVFFGPEGEINEWAATTVTDITAALLREAAGLPETIVSPLDFLNEGGAAKKPANAPEVLLVGTGTTQKFLPSHVTRDLIKMGIGVESMSTQAAARTYNILMAEGRRVIAALLPLESSQ